MDKVIQNNGLELNSALASGVGLPLNNPTQSIAVLDKSKRLNISHAAFSKAGKDKWTKTEASRADLIEILTQHTPGEKDGSCFMQGELVGNGRGKKLVARNHIIGFDIDSGPALGEQIQQIQNFGFAFVIYTTHSHGKSATEISDELLCKSANKSSVDDLSTEDLQSHLCDVSKYDASALEGVSILRRLDDGKVLVGHSPLNKYRVVFFLDEPFELQGNDPLEKANEWSARYRAVGRHFGQHFGFAFDKACVDPSRLFYFPRFPKDGAKPFATFVDGKALSIMDFAPLDLKGSEGEPAPKRQKKTAKVKNAKTAPQALSDPNRHTFNGFQLKPWSVEYNFRLTQALKDQGHKVWDDNGGGKAHFECPFCEFHSSDSKTGFFTVDFDGDANEGKSFVAYCSHNGCQSRNRDKLDFVKGFLAKGVLTVENLTDVRYAVSRIDVSDEIPLPEFGEFSYALHNGGIWCMQKREKFNKDNEIVALEVHLFTPISLHKGIRFEGNSGAFGRRFEVMRPDREIVSVDILTGEILKNNGRDLIGKLLNAGALISKEGEAFLIERARESMPSEHVTVTKKPGWYDERTYLTPCGEVIGDQTGLELAEGAGCQNKQKGGTLENWKLAAQTALASGNNHLALGIFAGCAGVLVQRAVLPNMAMMFSGTTSKGKSTAQKGAASQIAKPDAKEANAFRSLKTTDNAAETIFAIGNGSSVHCDEAQHMKGSDFQNLLFMFSQGAGKTRANYDQSARKDVTFSTFLTVSGEIELLQKIKGDGGSGAGGTFARVFEVSADAAKTLDSDTIGRIELWNSNFGHVLPIFVKHILDGGENYAPKAIRKRIEAYASKLAGDDAPPELRRLAMIPATLAECGQIMWDAALLPEDTDVDSFIRWAWDNRKDSTDPVERSIRNLKESLVQSAGIIELGGDDRKPYDGAKAFFNDEYYFITEDNLHELSGRVLPNGEVLATHLKKKGHLVPASSKNNSHRSILVSAASKERKAEYKNIDHYRIKRTFITGDPGSGE